MYSFTAYANSVIVAFHLLKFSSSENNIEISYADEDTIPEYVSIRDLNAGDKTTVELYPLVAWKVIAQEDISTGDRVSVGKNGQVKKTTDMRTTFGYAVSPAKAGQLVTVAISTVFDTIITPDDLGDVDDDVKAFLKSNTTDENKSNLRELLVADADVKALLSGSTTDANKAKLRDLLFSNLDVKAFLSGSTSEDNKVNLRNLLVSNPAILAFLNANPDTDTQTTLRTMIGAGTPYTLPAATTTTLGGVKRMPAIANSTATDVATLVKDFNNLLAALRTAGHSL
ncbi:head fiber protein [Bacillus phage B103]|uniref:Capsid fiber protein n=1 Tax=Bacillus phage B103 TaxID=2994042 RepID=CAPSF_BPB03|nr:head fiber protein [Bacillus phage B103]Q37889.1 RecName: Full=Capsid fiber protein; AltName: Full=Gene product 8.5; Short=gp8.5; AltName: Full=Head fiber protein; AltName: Full=Protein p8.5 [Bacillus phage B103]CAA67656.1 head fiber protein [Bacillus phage B103]